MIPSFLAQNAAPLPGTGDSLWGSVTKAVQSAAAPPPVAPPQPVEPQPVGALVGAFRDRVDNILPPYLAHAADVIAGRNGASKETEDIFSQVLATGKTRAQIQQERDQQDASQAATQAVAKTAHMDDSEFDVYLKQLQDTASHPPAAYEPGPLKGPSTLQLVAGGLGALLMPKFAATAIAAPFQAAAHEHAQTEQLAQLQADEARKAWKAQLDVQGDTLTAVQHRDEARAANDARLRIAQGNNATRIAATQLSLAGKAAIASQVSNDKELAQAVKVALASGPDARPAMFENLRTLRPAVFGGLGDDAIEAVGNLLPKETEQLGIARNQTAQAGLAGTKQSDIILTREARIHNLIQSGDLLGARKLATDAQASLDKVRTEWMPKEAAARIVELEAAADKARKTANDGFAGLAGAGRGTRTAMLRQQDRNEDAKAKTEAALAGVKAQIDAVQQRMALLGKGPMQDGIRAKLQDSLDKLGGIKAEKDLYLQRLSEMQARVQASLAAAPAPAAAAAAAAPGPPALIGKKLFGQTVRPGEEALFANAQKRLAEHPGDAKAAAIIQKTLEDALRARRK